MSLSKAQEMIKNKLMVCMLIKGENMGQPIYAFIGIKTDSLDGMLAEYRETGGFDPVKHQAIILACGPGEEPSEEADRYVRETFNFKDDKITLELPQ
jgi:hypothetical protein